MSTRPNVNGIYSAIWFDPRTGIETPISSIAGGSDYTLTPPSKDDWVLLLLAVVEAREADLSITNTADAEFALPDQQLTYKMIVPNDGPSHASGVLVTDTLPPGVSFDSASPKCSELDGTVSCDIDILLVDGKEVLEILVTIDSSASSTLMNIVDVVSDQPDPDTSNNAATAETLVVQPCTLALDFSYADGALQMDFTLGAAEVSTWSIWLLVNSRFIKLWSIPGVQIHPPKDFGFQIPFPSLGKIGFLSILTNEGKITCYDWNLVDTGTPSSVKETSRDLQNLFPLPYAILPND